MGLGWMACDGESQIVRRLDSLPTDTGGSSGNTDTGGSTGSGATGGSTIDRTGGSGGPSTTGGTGDSPAETGGATGKTGGMSGGGTGGTSTSTGGKADTGTGGAGATATGGAMTGSTGGAMTSTGPINVLIWNNAVAYGHQSRITAIPLLKARETTDNIVFDTKYAHTTTVAEGTSDSDADASVFTDAGLANYDVVFFLNTTGTSLKTKDGMETAHRTALQNFITKKGRGFVGTHSATDTYQGNSWTWYVDFIGANFATHSNYPTSGTARYANGVTNTNPILMAANTPNPWNRSEEWYTFTRDPLSSPIAGIKILLTCNDSQFGERASSWTHEMPMDAGATQAGRLWYSAMGHDVSAFKEKAFVDLIIAGIKWAAHRI